MENNLTKRYLINGPNNIVRLTDGNKILYIFGDYHLHTQNQKECPIDDNHDSIEIDKLLFKFMKLEKNREFDCFIESYSYLDPLFNSTYKDRYIDNVHKLFNSRIGFNDNKIFTHKLYSNFRFHYFDIRELLYLHRELLINYAYKEYEYPYSLQHLGYIFIAHNGIKQMLIELLNYFDKSDKKVIIKIKTKYNNERIKQKINLIYDDIIIKNINNTIKLNNKFIKLLGLSIEKLKVIDIDKKTFIKIQSKIYLKLIQIKENLIRIYLVTTDLNFLRRFLDKDYIKNTIIYTGMEHLCDITYLLIKYFNFKLTNIYYNDKKFEIEKITELKIENFEYLDKLKCYFDNLDKLHNPIQCSNLFNFPLNFS